MCALHAEFSFFFLSTSHKKAKSSEQQQTAACPQSPGCPQTLRRGRCPAASRSPPPDAASKTKQTKQEKQPPDFLIGVSLHVSKIKKREEERRRGKTSSIMLTNCWIELPGENDTSLAKSDAISGSSEKRSESPGTYSTGEERKKEKTHLGENLAERRRGN